MSESITINGVTYVPASTRPPGSRAVCVIDRGWIFAGDVEPCPEEQGFYLRRAVWVFGWEQIGFAKLLETEGPKADLRKSDDVFVPDRSLIFKVPVHSDWGLKAAQANPKS